MREFCTSGSVGAAGEQSPAATRPIKLRAIRVRPLSAIQFPGDAAVNFLSRMCRVACFSSTVDLLPSAVYKRP